MSTAVAVQDNAKMLEQVVIEGDLARLAPAQRVEYYNQVCRSTGLNPLTKPFAYIQLNGKLTLYALKGATDQLRKLNNVSLDKPDIQYVDDMVVVTVTGGSAGRTDTDVGVVTLGNLRGDARANAIMKAITKAKRRLTLSICGLGWLDETEIETIPSAQPVEVDENGEIVETVAQAQAQRREAPPADTPRARRRLPGAEDLGDGEVKRIIARIHALGEGMTGDASDPQKQLAAKAVRQLFGDVDDDAGRAMRRQVVAALFGIEDQKSWEKLSKAQAHALIEWAIIGDETDPETGKVKPNYDPNPQAVKEAAMIVAAFGEAQGQQRLPDSDEPVLDDKVTALIRRCAAVYFDEEWTDEQASGWAYVLWPDKDVDIAPADVAHAVVNAFDLVLAVRIAEDIGANIAEVPFLMALTEAHGLAGKKNAVAALEARAEWIHGWVATKADPDAEDGVSDVPF